ncbi:flavodoxin domain-containing protein [candidate division KSB1 bacterium]|nr:flavodoxin domain-containing protein [candidate division KSB1 bacterium]
MINSVLVAFSSKYGSTQEVAEAVVTTLREQGLEVDIQPMRQVKSFEGYRSVVMGAPLYMFHLLKGARRFLSKHRKALIERQVAFFALGPTNTGDEKEFQESREQLDKELAAYPWLSPVAVEIFGGVIDPDKIDGLYKLFMRQVPASDLRDWDAIRSWASDLAEKL